MDGSVLSPSHGQLDLTTIPEEDGRLSPSSARQVNCDPCDQTDGDGPPPPTYENNPNFDGEAFGPPMNGTFCCPSTDPMGPPEGMSPRYFDPMSLPPMPYPGQLYTDPPPHFFFPPLLYPNYMHNLEMAIQNPCFAAQFLYREGIRLPHHPLHQFPPAEPIFEYRQDLILSSSFQPIWALDPSRHFGRNIFVPTQPYVYTVIESVTHYCDQPYTTAVKGKWVKGIAHLPLAHHICICLDDGYKRYEEVIRVSLLNPDIPKEFTNAADAQFLSVSNRLRKPAPNRRPTFRAALANSLRNLLSAFSTVPVELNLTRPSDRNCHVDKEITIMVGGATEPFESFFYPLIQNVFQPFCFRLSGTHYIVTGHFFRPLMASGTLLLTTGEKQVLDTVNLHFSWKDRRIFALSTETAVAEMAYDERGNVAMSVKANCTYADYSGQYWGPHLLLVNSPKIPASCHPFMNLSLNPVLNRNFNPYQTYAFNTPPIFSSRTSCVPPPYRPGNIDASPLPYFYPMVTPAGMPIPGFGPMEPLHELISGDGPGIPFTMSPCNLDLDPEGNCQKSHSMPNSPRSFREHEQELSFEQVQSPMVEPERDECEEILSQEEPHDSSETMIPADDPDPDHHDHEAELNVTTSSSCSTLKFNPDACDFVPRGMTTPLTPPPPPESPVSVFCDSILSLPPLLLPSPTYSVPIQVLKMGPQIISLNEYYPDSGSDYFSDGNEGLGDHGDLEMVQIHPAPQQAHNASSSDNSLMVAHCTDTNVFLKNMDSQSSTLDAGSGTEAHPGGRRSRKSRSRRKGQSDHERSCGIEDGEGVMEVSFHNSWSEEVEAHNAHANATMDHEKIYRTAPPEWYPSIAYESKPRRGGPKGYRGRGSSRGDPAWAQRKFNGPPSNPNSNWRDVPNTGSYEGPPPPYGPPKPSYYQRRNSSHQNYEERPQRPYEERQRPYGPGNNDGSYYSGGRGSGRGNWRGSRGYRPNYSYSSEYQYSYGEREQGGRRRSEGYASADQDQDHGHYHTPDHRPKTAPADENKTDPTSEESHGEGSPLIITETTYTNSQNSSYRSFNAAHSRGRGGGGYRGGYRSYENRGNYHHHRDSSHEGEEGTSHDPSSYGGQRPLGGSWITRKYRKFNEMPREGEESIMDAFKDQGPGSNSSLSPRKGGTGNRYNYSPRNLIEIQTTPLPNTDDFPPLGSEQSRQSSPAPEVIPAPGPQPLTSKKKQKKYKKTKTRKDGEVVVGSSEDDIRSSGSTPRGKLAISTIPLCEVIPGDGIHIEPSNGIPKPMDDNPDEEADTEQDPDEKSDSNCSRSTKQGIVIGWDSATSCCGDPSD